MGIKNWVRNRIEKDTVKSTLTYERAGEEIVEEVLLKRSKIPLVGDWGRIYPPLNEDGSWNLFNLVFGGKKNFIKLLAIFAIIALLFYWVTGILGVNKEYMNGQKYIIVDRTSFDKFCSRAISEGGGEITNYGNLSILKFNFTED